MKRILFRWAWIACTLLPVCLAPALSAAPAHATTGMTFTVNSPDDVPDVRPGNGKCETAKNNKVCTLRAAIMETNQLGGSNTVNLPAGTYYLTIPGKNEDEGRTGDLDIKSNLTLKGAGSATTIIDGNRSVLSDRVIHILGGAVKIQGVTIDDGGDDAGDTQLKGGGIWIAPGAKLTLLKSVVGALVGGTGVGNRAAVGGGIYSQGKLTVKNSTISLNTAMRNTNNPSLDLYGGGIYGDGTSNTTLVKTTVTDNLAAFRGGGIHTDGKLTVKKSLVQNNIALNALGYYSYGGGIHNTGKVTIADSTI